MTEAMDLFREYRRTGAAELRDQLIEHHLDLVRSAATSALGRLPGYLALDDLHSAGVLGLFDAIEGYDPDRGVPFPAYARPRVRGAILDELRRLDYVPRRTRRRLRQAQHVIELLWQELGRQPADGDVAARLGIDIVEYHRLCEGMTFVSLDLEPRSLLREGLPDVATPSPLRWLEDRERRRLVGRLVDRLPHRERQVVATYYYEDLSMQRIGETLGVSDSRVSQIHSSAVLRLRAALRRERGQPAERLATAAARRPHRASSHGRRPRHPARAAHQAASRPTHAHRRPVTMTAPRCAIRASTARA